MTQALLAGWNQDELYKVSVGLGTYAGTRLVTLEDGVECGMRVIEMRSGGGLDFDITVDRSADIGRICIDGQVLSWHSPAGLTSPWLLDREGDNGQGFLRGFGGFLNTCGLDHVRQPERDEAEQTNQSALGSVAFPLHGKGTFQPGVIRGHGLIDDVDEPYIFCEVEFTQAMAFVSALRLRRRIEVPVGSQKIIIKDVVRNVGNNSTSQMQLYHFNIGFPMVAPGTAVHVGDSTCIWKSDEHDPLAAMSDPQAVAENQLAIFEHKKNENEKANETRGEVLVTSPYSGLSLRFEYPVEQLPCCQVLRMTGQGIYGMGIEPCSTGARSRTEARQRHEMNILQPGQEQRYDLALQFAKLEKSVNS